MKNQNLLRKFIFTTQGFKKAFLSEKSLKLELALAMLGGMVFFYLKPPLIWWCFFSFASMLMLIVELINTSIEVFLDHFHPQYDVVTGSVKDILSAAAFLSQVNFGVVIVLAIATH